MKIMTKPVSKLAKNGYPTVHNSIAQNWTRLPLVAAVMTLVACGGDNAAFSGNNPDPEKPPEYQQDTSGEIQGPTGVYLFEETLADTSGQGNDAEEVGHSLNYSALGNISYDDQDGIHALSSAAVFDGISGLRLTGNVIASKDYSVSMWVKPSGSNQGPLFYGELDGNQILLNAEGLTVSGQTGQGAAGDEPVTYTSSDFQLMPNVWQHVAFTVRDGFVDLYLDGERVYENGTLFTDNHTFENDWKMETDAFADFFSMGGGTFAIGVTHSDEDEPFIGKIDNVRIYNSALYHGNITTLAREVVNEGPSADMMAQWVDPNVELDWTLERFDASSIHIVRSAFSANETVVLTEESGALSGDASSYVDPAPIGESYQYFLQATDAEGHVYESAPTEYLRVPGTEAYAAVSAELNESSENIELTLYTENMDPTTFDVLRDTNNDIADAILIAEGVTGDTYIDQKDDDFPHVSGTPYYYWVSVTDGVSGEVTTSLALPQASASAAGTYIPPGTFVLEELTDGFCGVDGAVENNNAGFTGWGFANTDNAENMGIRWRIAVEEAGTYDLTVTYANGAGDNRWGRLEANGVVLVDQINLISTGAWTTYETVSTSIVLEAGETALSMIAGTGGGLGNIDSLTFSSTTGGSAPVGVACSE